MRFKEFLSEEKINFETVVSQIAGTCRPFLDSKIKKPIYRAVGVNHLKAGYSPHPQGRLPRDSGKEFNFTFNAGYQAAFGVPSIRTRSAFATGDANMTSEYGELAFFFPVGKFKFGWSPIFADSYGNEDKLEKFLGDTFKKVCRPGELTGDQSAGAMLSLLFSLIMQEISPAEWVKNANDKGEDVTLRVSKSLSKDYGYADYFGKVKALHDTLVETLREAFSALYKNDVELEAAIYSGNEILFYETDGYYLVPYDMVIEAMDEQDLGVKNREERYKFLLDAINNV